MQKEISFAKSITKFLDKRYAAKAEKLGCTDEEMKSLQEQYKRLKKQKEVYEKKLEAA